MTNHSLINNTQAAADERALVKRVRAGDTQGFALLYDLYAARVHGFALRLSGSAGDAEDIVQEVFVAAYAGRAQFRGRSRLLTWLLGIASRRWRDRCRHKPPPTLSYDDDHANDNYEDGGSSAHAPRCLEADVVNALTLQTALAQLDDRMREALLLVVSQGLTYREAALVMEEAVGTTKWRVSQATRKMAVLLTAVEDEFHEMQHGARADQQPCRG